MIDRIPPQSIEMEQAVLGAMLISSAAVEVVSDILVGADFYRDDYRTIFEAILAVHRRREKVDLLTVQEQLRDQDACDRVGGAATLMMLMNSTSSAANVAFYARVVRDKAVCRRILTASADLATIAHSEHESIDDAIASVEGVIREAVTLRETEDATPLVVLLNTAFEELEELAENPQKVTGISSGIEELDFLTRGWQPDTLVVIGARPSQGKTALGCHFALEAARLKKHVLIVSQEMSKLSITRRLLATSARVNGHSLRTGYISNEEWRKVGQAASNLSTYPITISDRQLTLAQLRAHCRRIARTRLDLVVVDYLQLLKSEGRKENRTTEVSALAEGLHDLAVELGVCIIALAQSSRAVDTRPDHRPVLSDLRDSGQIEAAADVVLFPFNRLSYQPADSRLDCEEMEILVAKNRDGMVGSARCVWFSAFTAFGDIAKEYDTGMPRLPYAEQSA